MWYESLTRRDEIRRFFELVRGEFPQLPRKWKELRASSRIPPRG